MRKDNTYTIPYKAQAFTLTDQSVWKASLSPTQTHVDGQREKMAINKPRLNPRLPALGNCEEVNVPFQPRSH